MGRYLPRGMERARVGGPTGTVRPCSDTRHEVSTLVPFTVVKYRMGQGHSGSFARTCIALPSGIQSARE